MPWWNILRRTPDTPPPTPAESPSPSATPRLNPSASPFPPARRVPKGAVAAMDEETRRRRLAVLQERRAAALYDLEQADLAEQPDNPWQQRIDLLTEALATIESDRRRLAALPPRPTHPVPPLPITAIHVETDEPATVSFAIAGQQFRFTEQVDWDERGGMVVRGDLRRHEGDPAALVPPDTPAEIQSVMRDAMQHALDAFAVSLRDLALDGNPFPTDVTLDQILKPDPDVGGWQDWTGTNPIRVQRSYRQQQLRAEAKRLDQDRRDVAEARRAVIDRLPVARKRLADAEAEIAVLTEPS